MSKEKRGKVGTSGREIAKALWRDGRPETEAYIAECDRRGLKSDVVRAPRLPEKEKGPR